MISVIAAISRNNVIGKRDSLPWYISDDLKRFKQLTLGNVVIMGRKTYESIVNRLGKPLPDRINVVITKQKYNVPEGVIITDSVESAIARAREFNKEIFIIGGASIYEQAIKFADKLELTLIHKEYEGDALFPKIDFSKWIEIKKEDRNNDGVNYSFVTFIKKKSAFIAFEGIDGSGKSTQMKMFCDYLFKKDKHNHLVLTREPYKETNIRKILFESDDPLSQSEKLAELFVSDRKIHANELISPCLEKGWFVITDRYKLSTITYQSAQGMDMQKLIDLHKDLPVPDITFIIDISIDNARNRMGTDELRKGPHKFEANLNFLENVRKNFFKAKDLLENERIFIVDGNRNIDEVFSEIKEIFERFF